MRSCLQPVAYALCMLVGVLAAFPVGASEHGPWNAQVLEGGVGLGKPLPSTSPAIVASGDWSMHAWIRADRLPDARILLAGAGDPRATETRYFAVERGRLGFWSGDGRLLASSAQLQPGRWHFVAAVARDGRLSLLLDGRQVASAAIPRDAVAPMLVLGPHLQPWADAPHFSGLIAGFTLAPRALSDAQLAAAGARAPDPVMTRYEQASPQWPVQTRQQAGLAAPQAPGTLPRSAAPFSSPRAAAVAPRQGLAEVDPQRWRLDDWTLAAAPELGTGDPVAISRPGYRTGAPWRAATVPGTVLTTLVDRGVYPDPDYGLDNLAIPESLSHHDWWYRSEFEVPAALAGRQLRLVFNGINYAGEIWLNGERLGGTRGAFVRGGFDVGTRLRPGARNAIAVRVSPPPHPGLPHEQSIAAGVGENGGMLALDGPTFIASEGWDWIPAVRDRNIGLWQDVVLHATGPVRIGDARVLSSLPDGDHRIAELRIEVPLHNTTDAAVDGELSFGFDGVQLRKTLQLAPGETVAVLKPDEFPQLRLHEPRLWWPNGYGEPALYSAQVAFADGNGLSDRRPLRFGIREVTYELSLFDDDGRLRRVELDLAKADARDERIVDVRRQAIRKTPNGWAQSFLPGAARSPAVRALDDGRLSPHLAIRVNGVRIAVKGGNWGMSDWRKRVSRERLEPYFRLQRDAHMNVVRNWVGQSTEPAFYELADEYGMLVFSDFWASTQNFQLEPQDEALFLRNAADVIRRYRHHPSIVLWFGRNEGVPHPLLNEGLEQLVAELDGGRLYMGSSNDVNLANSGPYNYREPAEYFTTLAQGFSVEVGTPSFSTLESFRAWIPEPDRWPISDAWAYHDWHQDGNGDTASFMQALRTKFGEADSLEDFERKAQMLNYESHRAIFEGLNAHLWTKNSGRLLWMSHPARPSNMWQIYSHDYDTHASYYGAKKGAEPVHVQMNLPDRGLVVVNNTAGALSGLALEVRVHARDGSKLAHRSLTVHAPAVAVAPVRGGPDLEALVAEQGLVFVHLLLRDAAGAELSRNLYWTAREPADLRALGSLAQVPLEISTVRDGAQGLLADLRNPSAGVALNAKLTLVDANGERILPAYYSDNYLSLLPGESVRVRIEAGSGADLRDASLRVRGWNVEPATHLPGEH